MPKHSIRSERLVGCLGGLSILITATPAWAHRRSVGFGFDQAGSADSNAFALTMAFFIAAMIVALLGVLFYFRWRAANPLPEPESIRSVINAEAAGKQEKKNPNDSSWEKPADWWKPGDNGASGS